MTTAVSWAEPLHAEHWSTIQLETNTYVDDAASTTALSTTARCTRCCSLRCTLLPLPVPQPAVVLRCSTLDCLEQPQQQTSCKRSFPPPCKSKCLSGGHLRVSTRMIAQGCTGVLDQDESTVRATTARLVLTWKPKLQRVVRSGYHLIALAFWTVFNCDHWPSAVQSLLVTPPTLASEPQPIQTNTDHMAAFS